MRCDNCTNKGKELESTIYCADGMPGGDLIDFCNAHRQEIGYMEFTGFEFGRCKFFDKKEELENG